MGTKATMLKWKKDGGKGKVVETNDAPATIAKAMELGWKRIAAPAKKDAE